MTDSTVIVETTAPVATVTINRPAAANAVDPATSKAMDEALDALESDTDVRAVVITARTDDRRVFCAGADLKAIAAGRAQEIARPGRSFAGVTSRTLRKPLIAAVDGAALGGGFELVLACTAVVATRRSTFGLPEALRGLVAGGGGVERLTHALGPRLAAEAVLTGVALPATVLHEHGVVNRLVAEPEDLLPAARSLGQAMAAAAPLAAEGILDIIRLTTSCNEALLNEALRQLGERLIASEDMTEGIRAWQEKRPPVWRGR